jgi:hypothetical protein
VSARGTKICAATCFLALSRSNSPFSKPPIRPEFLLRTSAPRRRNKRHLGNSRFQQIKPSRRRSLPSRDRWAGAWFYFEKAADRQTWDFALVTVAAAIVVSNGVVERSRIACGAVSAVPRRLAAVEEAIKGKVLNAELAAVAGRAGIRGARPLNYNGFKIPLMASLVSRAVRDATA